MRIACGIVVLAALVAAGARAEGDGEGWELRVADQLDVVVDTSTTLSLTIAGLDGRTVSRDGPIRVEVSSETLKLPRLRYQRRQAADPAAEAPRFDLKVAAPAAGDHQLAIDVRFWLCAAKTCRPVRTRRTVTVRAAAAAPPPVDAGVP